jgi:hypothetical protein
MQLRVEVGVAAAVLEIRVGRGKETGGISELEGGHTARNTRRAVAQYLLIRSATRDEQSLSYF